MLIHLFNSDLDVLIHLHFRLISDVAYLDIEIESPYTGEEQGYFSSSSSNGQVKYNIQHVTFILALQTTPPPYTKHLI